METSCSSKLLFHSRVQNANVIGMPKKRHRMKYTHAHNHRWICVRLNRSKAFVHKSNAFEHKNSVSWSIVCSIPADNSKNNSTTHSYSHSVECYLIHIYKKTATSLTFERSCCQAVQPSNSHANVLNDVYLF